MTMPLEDGSKTLIRVQAMRDFHQRKPKQKISNQDREPGFSNGSMRATEIATDIAKQTYKFRLGPGGLEQRPTPPRKKRPIECLSTSKIEHSSPVHSSAHPVGRAGKAPLAKTQPSPSNRGHAKTPHLRISKGRLTVDAPGQSGRIVKTADIFEQGMVRPCSGGKPDSFIGENIFRDPGIGSGDPFDAIPLLASRRLQCLLYHCEYQPPLWHGSLFVSPKKVSPPKLLC
jgi:hypothetical protein